MGMIFRSALPGDLDWDTRVEDVALSVNAIKRCLANMPLALDRDTPQSKGGMALPLACSEQEILAAQEPPSLWFTLPEVGFPMITDEFQRPIHPVGEYLRRFVSKKQDWDTVDDKDCWGMNYAIFTFEIKEKIESFLHICGGENLGNNRMRNHYRNWREKDSPSRNPEMLADRKLGTEDIFNTIRNPPETGVVPIFEKPGFWDTTKGLNTQGIETIQLASGTLSLDGAQWHLLNHTIDNSDSSPLGLNIP